MHAKHLAAVAIQSNASAWCCFPDDRRGAVALLGLVAMTSILGMAGFTIDLGMAYVQQARLQSVADSAAMAGAVSWVKSGSVAATTASIKAVVLANGWPATVIQAKTPYLAESPGNSACPAIQVGLTAPSSFTFLRAITSATSTTTTVYSAAQIGAPGAIAVFNTGVNAAGTILADGTKGDPHYTFSVVPSGASSTVQAWSTSSAPGWTTPNSNADWIGPVNGVSSAPTGRYGYKTTFDLTGYDPTTAKITGQVAADDQVTMQLNSAGVISSSAIYYSSASFKIDTGFTSGVNVLTFYVSNSGGGATGLRVEMTGTACLSSGKLALVQ